MLCASLVIGMHLASYHFDTEKRYNNVNPGVYANCDGFVAGTYHNSERRQSAYAGYHWEAVLSGIDVTVGVVSGYRRARLVPMLLPSYKFYNGVNRGSGSPGWRLTVVPPIPGVSGAFHVSYEF